MNNVMEERVGLSRAIGRYRRHRSDLPLLLAAAGWLFLAWLTLDVLPFQLYRKMMHPALRGPIRKKEAAQPLVKRVRWAVRTAARRLPWRAVCFHQGLAAQQLLCRAGVPAELHYGVAKSASQDLEAHVWVTANGCTVVGGETKDRFTLLAIFPAEEEPVERQRGDNQR